MDLTSPLPAAISGLGYWEPVLAAVGIGGATALLIWGAALTSAAIANPVRRRLSGIRSREAQLTSAVAARPGRFSKLWERFEPKKEGKRVTGLRLELQQAGLRSPYALGALYAAKALAAGVAAVSVLALLPFIPKFHPNALSLLAILGAAGYVGSLLPNMWLDRRRDARKDALMRGFPDALDLMVACTEAGLSLNGAMERVSEQMPESHPELAQELGLVNAEIRAGVDRTVAMRNLAERTGLAEIRGLVALITQSGRLGTGIASTLRVYSEEFRDRRMQAAEERAATVGTKLIFPLVFTLWPAFFVVAVGPAVVGAIHALSGIELPTPK
jgi:tight adherence protein C